MVRKSCAYCAADLWIQNRRFASVPWLFAKCPRCGESSIVKLENFGEEFPSPRFKPIPVAPTLPPPRPTVFERYPAPPVVAAPVEVAAPAPEEPTPFALQTAPVLVRSADSVVTTKQVLKQWTPFGWDRATIAGSVGLILLAAQWQLDVSRKAIVTPSDDHVTVSNAAPVPVKAEEPPQQQQVVAANTDLVPPNVNRSPAIPPAEQQQAKQGRSVVEVVPSIAVMRAGPGVGYARVGIAKAELKLIVRSATDTWTEVENGSPDGTAWIRSDLLKNVGFVAEETPQ